mgnify:FL=1|jgi:hypothetical protein
MLGQLAATSAKLKDTIDRLGLEHFMYLRKAGFSTEDANLLYPLIEKLGNIAKSVEIEERRGRKVELDLHMLVLSLQSTFKKFGGRENGLEGFITRCLAEIGVYSNLDGEAQLRRLKRFLDSYN